MNTSNKINHSKKGMTLVETLVVLGILVLISGGIWALGADIFTSHRAVSDSLETSYEAQILLKKILRELREMSVAQTGAYPLAMVGTSTISFYSDADDDGLAELITYYVEDGALKRSEIVPTGTPLSYLEQNATISTLASNLHEDASQPLFRYYDEDFSGNETDLPQPVRISEVRLIRADITLDVDPSRSPLPVTYSISASLRNLKSNL